MQTVQNMQNEQVILTNYFTSFRFQLPSFLPVQRPPSTHHRCLTSRRAPTSCKSRKSSRQGSDWSTQAVGLIGGCIDVHVDVCVDIYTWTTKKTSVSLWKKGFLTHTGPSLCLPLRRCRGPCFQTCASRSRQLGRVRPVARARWGQSLIGKINKFQVEEKKKWGSDYSFSSEDASKAKPTGFRS